MKMNVKALVLAIVATLAIYISIYFIQESFLGKTSAELVHLLHFSTMYFMIACIVCLLLLEVMTVFVADKLAMGFLVLMMIKLGGFVMVYMNGPDLPKGMRVLVMISMFTGIILEVIYLYYRISKLESSNQE